MGDERELKKKKGTAGILCEVEEGGEGSKVWCLHGHVFIEDSDFGRFDRNDGK